MHCAPAPCAPHALARCQESDYCTAFSSNNAPQTPQKSVTRVNIKHGNDRMGVVNQMSSVIGGALALRVHSTLLIRPGYP